MKKHIEYMLANIENDARILMTDSGETAKIYPSYKTIKRSSAKVIIETLRLIYVPAYKDHRVHEIGSTLFVFKENAYKYGVKL